MSEMLSIIDAVRNKQPLVHNITNQVVVNFTANGLYAIGAAPVMANAVQEAAEMATNADAILLNIGTLTQVQVDAMVLAGKAANKKGIPVILDPVGVGATPFRTESVKRVLAEVDVSLIRGNNGEMALLAGLDAEAKGVDAVSQEDNKEIAIRAAKQLKIPVAVTGKQDVITDGINGFLVDNGHQLLTKVTGAGCLLGSVIAAFLATGHSILEATASAISFYGAAAEKAAEKADEPGGFQMSFLDALYLLTSEDFKKVAKINTLSSD